MDMDLVGHDAAPLSMEAKKAGSILYRVSRQQTAKYNHQLAVRVARTSALDAGRLHDV